MMIRRLSSLLLLAVTSCALVADMRPETFSQERAHIETEKLCVLAGIGDERAPGQKELVVSGTDMGVTYTRGSAIEIIFGDTGTKERVEQDDAFGAIDLAAFPDGDAVEDFCRDHGHAPPITFAEKSDTTFAGVNPGVAMDGLKTPIIAFANGQGASAREFAVFVTAKPVACTSDDACGGFTCDTGLGYLGNRPEDNGPGLTLACVDGSPNCADQTLKGKEPSGVCRDPHDSLAAPGDGRSRVDTVVWRQLVGLRSQEGVRDRYSVKEWRTADFHNAIGVSVEDFDPARAAGIGNDYRPASGDTLTGDGVLIWGRPGWIAVGSEKRNLKLYLTWQPMPQVEEGDRFEWKPRYFAGVDPQKRPIFSEYPLRAAPLDLFNGEGSTTEAYDTVGQMSVRWIAPMKKWVMFYGGGFPENPGLCFALGSDCAKLRKEGASIRMRTADNPWGPWSFAKDILIGGEPREGPRAGTQYAPGGIMHHPDCRGDDCAPSTVPEPATGALYAPNIIEEWTEIRSDRSVDLYWNVSSWNPYRVMLMKTRIVY